MESKLLYWLLLLLLGIHYSCLTCAAERQDFKLSDEMLHSARLLAAGMAPRDGVGVQASVTKAVELLDHYWRYEFPAKVMAGRRAVLLNVSDGCRREYHELWNTKDYLGLPLGIYLLDATGKPGAGYLDGNVFAYGSYDECFGIENTQFCLAPITLSVVPIPLVLNTGICMPSKCSVADLEAGIEDVASKVQLQVSTNKKLVRCETEKQAPYNAGAILMILVCCLFAMLAFIGTAVDWVVNVRDESLDCQWVHKLLKRNTQNEDMEMKPFLEESKTQENEKRREKTNPLDLITAFSAYKVLPTVLSTKQPSSAISSINGIRVISMFWIILGHTHFWAQISMGESDPNISITLKKVDNLDNYRYVLENVLPRFTYQVIINAIYGVDTFFFLGGLLVTYLTLREMQRRKGRFPYLTYYLHRYLRLTPTYAFLLFFYWFLTVHLADGPLYSKRTGPASLQYRMCQKYWWTNLLYISNLYPGTFARQCMSWSWYLANDMQFFVVAPLMIVFLYFRTIFGFISTVIFLVCSFIVTGVVAGVYDINASFLSDAYYEDFNPNVTTTHSPILYTNVIYIKPYAHLPTYIVGIVLGYLFYKKATVSFSNRLLNWAVYGTLWSSAAFLCLSTVYGLYGTWHGHPFGLAENILYITFSRFAWAIGVALVVFSCHNGYGGIVNTFLSMKIWIPLSRLTFTTYLIHPIVLTVFFWSLRNPFHYTDISIAVYAVATGLVSYAAAGVVAVFVEFPLANVETAIFKLLGFGVRESSRLGTEVGESAEENETNVSGEGNQPKPNQEPSAEQPKQSGQ